MLRCYLDFILTGGFLYEYKLLLCKNSQVQEKSSLIWPGHCYEYNNSN